MATLNDSKALLRQVKSVQFGILSPDEIVSFLQIFVLTDIFDIKYKILSLNLEKPMFAIFCWFFPSFSFMLQSGYYNPNKVDDIY